MVNRSIGKLRKGTGSTDGTFEAVNWKRKRTSYSSDSESEQNVQMVKRGPGRPRKNDTSIQGSSQVNSKKSRSYNYSESEDDVQESRPRRKSARHVNYNESDYDFEDSPIKKKNKRRTIVSENNDASSSLSSLDKSFSELELDFGDLAVEEKSDIELAEVPVRKTIPKQKETRNHTDENVEKWFDHKRARNPGMVKSRPERWTKEQKSRLKEAFAASRKPNEETIADLVAELELTTVQVKQYFAKQRHENPIPGEIPRVLSKEEAEPTLMEYFQRDPNFHDYGNTELREQTGWSRRRLREFFENARKEHGIVKLFKRQRNSKNPNQFEEAMGQFFKKRQFLEKPDEVLELESGGSWKRISNWLDKKRYETLKAFLKKEISVLPNEMNTFEELMEKYCLSLDTHPDVILYIEWKENVHGDSLAEYLMERSFVLKMLENHRDREVHVEQEEVVLDYQINENRSAESDVQQAKDERGNENGGNGIDTSDEAPIDQELYGQIDLPVPENPVPEFKNIPLFNNPREKDQKPTGVNHIQNAFNDFQDETKNVPLFVPAPGYRDQSQEPREEVEEKLVNSSESESDEDIQMVKRGPGRPRKNDTPIQGTSQVNSKKSRSYNYSESEDDVQESRTRRKSARHVNYNESDNDFEDSPIKKENKRRTIVSENNDASLLESEMDSELVEIKPKSVRENKDTAQSNLKIAEPKKDYPSLSNRFSDEQIQVLQTVFCETQFPTKEEREKLAEKTNLSIRQVTKWFDHKRARNLGIVKSRPGRLTKEQKSRMNEVFAASRYPDEKKVEALVAELELTTVQVKQYFAKQRYENPIPEIEAKAILVEYLQRDPNFHDYGNPELRKKTGWSKIRLSEFFENVRRKYGIVKLDKKRYDTLKTFLKKETSALPNEMETFEKLVEKYCLCLQTDADVILYIELKENVDGDGLAQYVTDRSFVLEMLENHRTGEVHVEQDEVVLADPNEVQYPNQPVLDTPEELLVDTELYDPMEETVPETSQQDEKRSKRGSARRVDSEPIERKSKSVGRAKDAVQTKIKITDSKRDTSSLSSSLDFSELEFDIDDSAAEENSDNELAEDSIQETISEQKRTRKAKNENQRPRMRFTYEQIETLMAVFCEAEFPSEEQKEKLAKETNRITHQVGQYFSTQRQRKPIPAGIPRVLSEEEARPILLEYFQQNPFFCDYGKPELREKTGWLSYRERVFC
ncbi:hypothetical protein L5515_017028 [Caenorhabditis briggsae]|uniref:Homeobox domain-containing protein n=1 Tax=Caenorhabditis briggsae TaxID=6238 RepID=A0AAE9F7I2_CAEBR|nr:hypothetical protein L5515_017028 [Caenorhabditis briggsae]